MNTNSENNRQQPSRVPLFTIILVGLLMSAGLQHAHADNEPFDAYETIREAGIGTNAPDYHKYSEGDTGEHYIAPDRPKSESIYLHGKTVCFKLESDVSVAYYCN